MNVYRSLAELPPDLGPTVATIGNFDGVHRGHQWVIAEVIARAKAIDINEQLPTHTKAVPLFNHKKSMPLPTHTKAMPLLTYTEDASSRPEQRTASPSAAEWRDPRISPSPPRHATSLAITLDPHPARVLGKQANLTLITPLEEKLELLAATGIDAVFVLPFDLELSRLTAREFASRILRDALHVIEVHEGENFRFGYHAEAGIEGLEQLGRDLGFAVKTYTPSVMRGEAISSSRIRKLISVGDVSQARALLGRSFSIASTPASGRGYGTKYTVPTINLAPYAELLPANGVYITTLTMGTGDQTESFEAVTNVGNRPTFGEDSFTVESHLLNFHPVDLTEATPLRLTFLRRLRPEHRFPSPEALRAQIGLDVGRVQRYFALCKVLNSSSELFAQKESSSRPERSAVERPPHCAQV